MADQTRLDEVVNELNALLGDVTPYKLAVVAPSDVQHVAKNARYMPGAMYRQLVDNIKKDGNLASLPFCWRKDDGTFVVLSGNHRVDAARDAGIPVILILYTDAKLSKSQAVSIQLSHNALAGADVPTVLLELWKEIDDLQDKAYAGLDEGLLDNLAKAGVVRIDRAGLQFEELVLLFLPSEIERIKDILKRLGGGQQTQRLAARVEEFSAFFDTLLSYKEATGIVNSATAFLGMIGIVQDWLDAQIEVKPS